LKKKRVSLNIFTTFLSIFFHSHGKIGNIQKQDIFIVCDLEVDFLGSTEKKETLFGSAELYGTWITRLSNVGGLT